MTLFEVRACPCFLAIVIVSHPSSSGSCRIVLYIRAMAERAAKRTKLDDPDPLLANGVHAGKEKGKARQVEEADDEDEGVNNLSGEEENRLEGNEDLSAKEKEEVVGKKQSKRFIAEHGR